MNLLFDFLKHLHENERAKLRYLKVRGTVAEVWQQINQQVNKGSLDKGKILTAQKISPAHFDKITSELLSKCYAEMFPEGGLQTLSFLVMRGVHIKHFYAELNRQVKKAEVELNKEEKKKFYKTCLDLMNVNIPIVLRDEAITKKVGQKYVNAFDGKKKKEMQLTIECMLITMKINEHFAAAHIKKEKKRIEKRIAAIGTLPANSGSGLVFEYYWSKMFLQHSLENFDEAAAISREAIKWLKNINDGETGVYILRFELKLAEFLYYLSQFEQAFRIFKAETANPLIEKIPDRGYYTTKYVQLCLITGHMQEVSDIMEGKRKYFGERLYELIAPRDIFSFIKYYLFKEQYEDAFRFIQLGFEKNPKGKYFQYEVELRNLQTAYFFLTGQLSTVIEMCNRNIKYLRFHGYGTKDSDFPYFYIITKAIFEKKTTGKDLSAKEQGMLNRYQEGSYAIYGKLLLKMLDK